MREGAQVEVILNYRIFRGVSYYLYSSNRKKPPPNPASRGRAIQNATCFLGFSRNDDIVDSVTPGDLYKSW
jgi:hypothetical protein